MTYMLVPDNATISMGQTVEHLNVVPLTFEDRTSVGLRGELKLVLYFDNGAEVHVSCARELGEAIQGRGRTA